ncbi:hypothetical protein LEMLEM_LOCUS15137 [Lemmus lemmus]
MLGAGGRRPSLRLSAVAASRALGRRPGTGWLGRESGSPIRGAELRTRAAGLPMPFCAARRRAASGHSGPTPPLRPLLLLLLLLPPTTTTRACRGPRRTHPETSVQTGVMLLALEVIRGDISTSQLQGPCICWKREGLDRHAAIQPGESQ